MSRCSLLTDWSKVYRVTLSHKQQLVEEGKCLPIGLMNRGNYNHAMLTSDALDWVTCIRAIFGYKYKESKTYLQLRLHDWYGYLDRS